MNSPRLNSPKLTSLRLKSLELPGHIQVFFKPETYPHPTGTIDMIQTHASWVFLTGDFAYKFKKPVDFGFMDFSTLAKRHYYCEQELNLNRRLAPDLYLEVLPVYQQRGLQGHGKIIDYCLKMVQFDQSGLFDQKLAHGELNPQWMDDLATDVVHFHAAAEINNDPDINHAALLTEHIHDNLSIAARHADVAGTAIIDADKLHRLATWAESTLQNKQTALAQRQYEHHIRHCHGDMHFRNITLIDGKPTLFDCIEFNDAYRIIDTMNDVAFLIMDCDAHGRPDLGMRFLSRYLEFGGDYAGLALLPLYLFYRAGVRGKVACILANELPAAQQPPQWQEAARYFNLALRYTRASRPALFAIGGLSGSGKSHLALDGCGKERAIMIRSDATRKRIAADFPYLELYGKPMHIHTYKAMFDAARTALAAGFSVILDATFLHPDSRQQVHALAKACDVPLHFFWLDVDTPTLKTNIRRRQQSGHDISDADLTVLDLQLAEYQRPSEAWVRFLKTADDWP